MFSVKLSALLLITLVPLTYARYTAYTRSGGKLDGVALNRKLSATNDEFILNAEAPLDFADYLQPAEGSGDFWENANVIRSQRDTNIHITEDKGDFDEDIIIMGNQRKSRALVDNTYDKQLKQIFNTAESGVYAKEDDSINIHSNQTRDVNAATARDHNSLSENKNAGNTTVQVDTRFSILDTLPHCQEGYIPVRGRCRKLA